MIEVAQRRADHLTLRAGIGAIETDEQTAAGIEVSGQCRCWVHGRGRLQPFEQAPFEVLKHRDLAHVLACRKLKRTPYLLQALDKHVTIKGHTHLYARPSHPPWPSGGKK